MKTEVRQYSKPELRSPIMISGLPGIGNVAWLTANHFVKELNAELFAEIFSPSFSPKVFLRDDSTVGLVKGDFYFWKNTKSGPDLILFTANEQPYSPEGQYSLSDEVLLTAKKLGVVKLITTGGFSTGAYVEKPKIYGAGTSVQLVEELLKYDVVKLAGGTITGTNGLLFGLAKRREIPAVCMLAETPGFIPFDAKAALAIVSVLAGMFQIEIDTRVLEKQILENERIIKEAQELGERKEGGEKELHYVS